MMNTTAPAPLFPGAADALRGLLHAHVTDPRLPPVLALVNMTWVFEIRFGACAKAVKT